MNLGGAFTAPTNRGPSRMGWLSSLCPTTRQACQSATPAELLGRTGGSASWPSVIERLNEVFGTCGVGWRCVYRPLEEPVCAKRQVKIIAQGSGAPSFVRVPSRVRGAFGCSVECYGVTPPLGGNSVTLTRAALHPAVTHRKSVTLARRTDGCDVACSRTRYGNCGAIGRGHRPARRIQASATRLE